MKVNVVWADGELQIQPVVTIVNVFEKRFLWQTGEKWNRMCTCLHTQT